MSERPGLRVLDAARIVVDDINRLLKSRLPNARHVREAAESIPSNIQEGFGREAGPDRNQFLRYGRASAEETNDRLGRDSPPKTFQRKSRRIIDDHQSEASQKSIALSLGAPPDSLWTKTDDNRLRHVVENLLSNALKYTQTGGVVNVVLGVVDGTKPRVRVSVRDNGPGIPVEAREHLFDPFYRVPSSEHRVRGSGLGLAVSRRIARLLGGDLTLNDAPGGGSDFVLTLPTDKKAQSLH